MKNSTRDIAQGTWVLGLVAILAPLLAFSLAKPFGMDEWSFLAAAKKLSQDFPHLYEGDRAYLGQISSWAHFKPPLFVPAYLAFVTHFFSASNPVLIHLAFFPFVALAALGMHQVALGLGISPRWSTLLFLASPCFFTSSQFAMSDTPMIAFFLISLGLYLRGRRVGALLLCGFFATLAWLCRYPGILVAALIFLDAMHSRRWKDFCIAAFLPVATFLGWAVWTEYTLGQSHLTLAFDNSAFLIADAQSPAHLLRKALAYTSFLGGSVFFAPVFFLLRWPNKMRLLLALLLAGGICGVLWGRMPIDSLGLLWIFLAAGILLLLDAAGSGRFLCFWVLGFLTILCLVSPFAAMRYLLPVLPAVCLVLIKHLPSKVSRGVILASALAVSICLSISDVQTAHAYHRVARDVSQQYAQAGPRLFFSGEWGWRWAMERQGGSYWTEGLTDFRPGDCLAVIEQACPASSARNPGPSWQEVQNLPLRIRFPLHLMDKGCQAGFYSDGWGLLPYAPCVRPVDTVHVFRYGM